ANETPPRGMPTWGHGDPPELRMTTVTRRASTPLLRQPGRQARRLTRGFASSPRGEFALIGKGSPRSEISMRKSRLTSSQVSWLAKFEKAGSYRGASQEARPAESPGRVS